MKKLRLIQCGVGGFGYEWLKSSTLPSPDFDLAAMVDVSVTNLEKAGEDFGIPADRRFTSLEAALATVPADAVLSVTPPPVHIVQARQAFGCGLHFMTEKPLAETIKDGTEMVELASIAGRQLMVSQQYRFRACVRKIRELLLSGAIGELGHGHLDFYIPADFTGTFRENMEFPLLLDMAIHHLDLIRCVTGLDITKVTAQSFNPPWSWYRHEAGLKMLMELEGGIPFSYSGDWSALGRSTTWNGAWRLQGSRGSLHLESDRVYLARSDRWSKNEETEEIDVPVSERTDRAESLHRFAEAIRQGVSNENSGRDNLRSLAIVIGAMQSVREARPVTLAEVLAAKDSLPH